MSDKTTKSYESVILSNALIKFLEDNIIIQFDTLSFILLAIYG